MARFTASRRGWVALAAAAGLSFASGAVGARNPADVGIRLEISPRICTLTGNDKQCSTPVHAQWRSPREESLCLVILARPEVQGLALALIAQCAVYLLGGYGAWLERKAANA